MKDESKIVALGAWTCKKCSFKRDNKSMHKHGVGLE